MKKLIWVVVVLIILQAASKQPFFKDMIYNIEQQVMSDATAKLTTTIYSTVKQDLQILLSDLSQEEASYLTRKTNSLSNSKAFYQTYCKTRYELMHSVLSKETITRTCAILDKHLIEI